MEQYQELSGESEMVAEPMEENKGLADMQRIVDTANLAEDQEKEKLEKIGIRVIEWLDQDEEARSDWTKRNNEWLKLACQVQTKKTHPWPDAANVKYPLLTTAAMQFAARSYPALVPGPNLVQGIVVGRDLTGEKFNSAMRVGKHMSYQLMYEMDGWEEDMDRLCMMIPIVGCLFKKTYYDSLKKQNVSELVLPNDLIIDYFARSVESASRKSHILYKTNNDIVERVSRGLWLKQEFEDPISGESANKTIDAISGMKEPQLSPATPHKFVECHCSWDLDGDGYDEPYIITVHYKTKKVVRIVARFDMDGVEFHTDEKTGKEKLVRIVPTEYFTKFGFIPNPDGSIYDMGFGLLLGGINESINTLTNQLLDSGTLNNLQAGFLGRGIRVRSGNTRFIPGEWKPVDFVGDDIKKHIFPLPTKEPSAVLFKLLETLVTSGKELASVAEIFVGKMPGQNTPATTTMATIEQGLKVFTAIHKRLYRALAQEYKKLFRLNSIHMDDRVYFALTDESGQQQPPQEMMMQGQGQAMPGMPGQMPQQMPPQMSPQQAGASAYRADYSRDNLSVKPNADPNVVSQSQKLMKVQSYGALLQLGTISPQEYTKRFLEAVEAENITKLMQVPPPQPSPEEKAAQMEMQIKQQDAQTKTQATQMKSMMDQQEAEMNMKFKEREAALDAQMKQFDLQVKEKQAMLDLMVADAKAKQSIRQTDEKHQESMRQAKEKQKVAPKPKGK